MIYAALIAVFVYFFASKLETKIVGAESKSIAISLMQFQSAPKEVEEIKEVEPIKEVAKVEEKVIYKEKAPPKKIVKKEVKKEKIIKKVVKKEQPKEPLKSIEQPQVAQNVASTQNNAVEKKEILVFGKDNDPFLLSIKKAIDKNLFYPRKARMMRQEGRIIVEFSVLKDGSIKGVKILQGSKHKALEKAAIKTLSLAQKSFLKPKNEVKIQIPIVFVLR